MIKESILRALLNSTKEDFKDNIILELIKSIQIVYPYGENKIHHILEMLVDDASIYNKDDVDIDSIRKHAEAYLYKPELYDIKDMAVNNIDNITGDVYVSFCYKSHNSDDNYSTSRTTINYIEYPDIIKTA